MDSRDTKPKGWFSRRHASREAHETARAKYLADRGPEARRENADSDQRARAMRSPQEQLDTLDKRLGKGRGAKRERARLHRQIDDLANREGDKKADRAVNSKRASKTTKKVS